MSRSVTFDSLGTRVAADLYRPDGPGPWPAVVMAGGWCYVKELAQPRYASEFARRGFAALVFDYRTCGASGGEPRWDLDPRAQVEDYRQAVTYLLGRPDIDASRIGAWGISYSGGHVLLLGATDPRVSCVAGVVPVVDGFQNMRLAHGTLGFRRLQAALAEAREKLDRTGEHSYLPHQPAAEGDIGTWPFPRSRETFARLRAAEAPAYEGVATARSTEFLQTYDVGPFLPRLLGTPTLLVVAEGDDHTHWDLAATAFAAIPEPRKRMHVVPRSTHLSLYEDAATAASVAGVCADWFEEHLS